MKKLYQVVLVGSGGDETVLLLSFDKKAAENECELKKRYIVGKKPFIEARTYTVPDNVTIDLWNAIDGEPLDELGTEDFDFNSGLYNWQLDWD